MRKRMTVIAVLMLCSTAMTPALAQNCTSSTRCAELGYTLTASDCVGQRTLPCPFDSSKLWCAFDQKIGLPVSLAEPGMILYSDGSVSNEVIIDKTPVGIVAYVSDNRRFAMALETTISEWGELGDVPCLVNQSTPDAAKTDFDGAANTQCLISNGNSYPAAEYCNTYKPVMNGTGSSGWYLPAAGELFLMHLGYDAINLGLQKLSRSPFRDKSCLHISSSETDNSFGETSWLVDLKTGAINSYVKGSSTYVRCVLAF